MTQSQLQRTEAIMIIALQNLQNICEYDRESREIVSMRLLLQHEVSLDPSAICEEIEDLIEILRDRDRELLSA